MRGIVEPEHDAQTGHCQAGPAPVAQSTRRTFLRQALLMALAPLVASHARPAHAATTGAATVDVRDKGAKGDGKTDDTWAIQDAIDALPEQGGTVVVPAGHYMVDATQALRLRSNMILQLDPQATIEAIPNARKRSHVIKVWRAANVEIRGGRVVGEREGHTGEGGEWGYGINIQASHNVKVSGTHISNCWGDGIWIGALGKGVFQVVSSDVTIENVVSTNNRRQGMSIGPCKRVRIIDCTFSDTHGTKPESGIDLEPMAQGPTRDVLIQRCTFTGNKGCGVEIHHNVEGVIVRDCTIEGNAGYGVYGKNVVDLWIDGNQILDNGLVGIALVKKTRDVRITGNTVRRNSARYVHHMLKSIKSIATGKPDKGDGKPRTEVRIDETTRNVTLSDNTF
ncbi:right-handed parallel beta-helix repeat-containing protein [Frateuria hangzhouensis]|uniref:right-handed parallel beta-helix repeat-containing protein n=1 Tax=Frateuria hangzhouensis TaxID=2995589 RepID=UPI002260F1BC|nr:right-handed parallel beta-helix repeat-containing protein [Frateuria sp. STR12]MCX7513930.1 right-handed parallel beta-helix repeat-containing protein [Frateuria sp. STR12]